MVMIMTGFLWGIGIICATAFVKFVVIPLCTNGALADFIQEIKEDVQEREDGNVIDAEYEVVDSRPETA